MELIQVAGFCLYKLIFLIWIVDYSTYALFVKVIVN